MSRIGDLYIKKKNRIRFNGIFYAAVSSASFGFSPLFSIGLLSAGLHDFDILSYRWAIAAIVLMIYAVCKKKSLRLSSLDEAWKIFLLSMLRAITSATLLIGYANISTGVASTINFMYPIIVTICMVVFYGEKRTWIDLMSIIVSFIGVYLMASGDSLNVEGGDTALGLACSIISAISFAAYYIFMKQLKADKIEVVKFTTWIMLSSALYFIIGALILNGRITIVSDARSWAYIMGLGLWATMVSNITGVKAIRRIGPTMTSILGALQPLTAVVLGILYLDEHMEIRTITGIALILFAVSVIVIHQEQIKHADSIS